jgi:Amt family ammonium transporter
VARRPRQAARKELRAAAPAARAGTTLSPTRAGAGATIVYGVLKSAIGLRLDPEEEWNGADLTIHKVSATAERETSW